VKARVKGHFYTSGHYGNKRLASTPTRKSTCTTADARPMAVLAAVSFLLLGSLAAADEGWTSLFDGRSLAGWKASENRLRSVSWTDDCLRWPRAHLFYGGPDGKASFETSRPR